MNFDSLHIRVTFKSSEDCDFCFYSEPNPNPFGCTQFDLEEFARIAIKEFKSFLRENSLNWYSWNYVSNKLFEKHCRDILIICRTEIAEFGKK